MEVPTDLRWVSSLSASPPTTQTSSSNDRPFQFAMVGPFPSVRPSGRSSLKVGINFVVGVGKETCLFRSSNKVC